MTWPKLPPPWDSERAYFKQRYRAGYHAGYLSEPARVFADPRTQGARAYFAGFKAGIAAREAGVEHEETIPVPDNYTSGDARRAYRAGYRVARKAVASHLPLLEQMDLYSKNRALLTDNLSWSSGTAFDAGWKAGALSVGVLSPPLPGQKAQENIHQDPAISGGRTR